MIEIILLSVIILLQLFIAIMCWAIGSQIDEVLRNK
jgi:hypothetical protein